MGSGLGRFALVLHAHLPFVLSYDRMMEEWLCEAVAESYLPLLAAFRRLADAGISPQITIGLTPVLVEQLESEAFAECFRAYLRARREAAEEDRAAFAAAGEDHRAWLATLWDAHYARCQEDFDGLYGGRICAGFRALQEAGHLDVMTSAATHAYLPLLGRTVTVRAQVAQGVRSYVRVFGRAPHGFWLPECGYRSRTPDGRSGLEEILSEAGLRYTIVDEKQVRRSSPEYERTCPHRVYRLGTWGEAGGHVALLARDERMSGVVWERDGGYPGHSDYMEFHKEHGRGRLRYWRVTDARGDLADKDLYHPEWAFDHAVPRHAQLFHEALRRRLERHATHTGAPGTIVCAFDAELFGHWWFEGPAFLEALLHRLAADPDVEPVTCERIVREESPAGTVWVPESSWGDGGDHRVWWNARTARAWRAVHAAEAAVEALMPRVLAAGRDGAREVARQAIVELLLLGASDWEFMISTGNTVPFARQRLRLHTRNVARLVRLARVTLAGRPASPEEEAFVHALAARDFLFRDADAAWP